MAGPTRLSDIFAGMQGGRSTGFEPEDAFGLLAEGFLPVPAIVLRDPALTPLHALVLGLAKRFSMRPPGLDLFASQAYLADLFSVSKRHIQRVLADLRDLRYLEIKPEACGSRKVKVFVDVVSEDRRQHLRPPHQGVDLTIGRPRETTYRSPQTGLRRHTGRLGTTREGCEKRRERTLVLVHSLLETEARKLVKLGTSPRSALAEVLGAWRERLARVRGPKAREKALRYLGIRAKVARTIAKDTKLGVLTRAAACLDVETENPAGAFLWHLKRILDGSEAARGP